MVAFNKKVCCVKCGAASNGRRVSPLAGAASLPPTYIGGGGSIVTHTELYAFVGLLIAFATLIFKIAKKK